MSPIILIAFLLIGILFVEMSYSLEVQPCDCAENEKFNTCASACGEYNCGEKPCQRKTCTLQCVTACTCKPGYIRLFQEKCVSLKKCRKLLRGGYVYPGSKWSIC